MLGRNNFHLFLGRAPREGGAVSPSCLDREEGGKKNFLTLPYMKHFWRSHLSWTPSQARSRQNRALDESHMVRSTGKTFFCVFASLLQSTQIPEIHEHLQRIYFFSISFLRLAQKLNNNVNFSCPLVTSSHTCILQDLLSCWQRDSSPRLEKQKTRGCYCPHQAVRYKEFLRSSSLSLCSSYSTSQEPVSFHLPT